MLKRRNDEKAPSVNCNAVCVTCNKKKSYKLLNTIQAAFVSNRKDTFIDANQYFTPRLVNDWFLDWIALIFLFSLFQKKKMDTPISKHSQNTSKF